MQIWYTRITPILPCNVCYFKDVGVSYKCVHVALFTQSNKNAIEAWPLISIALVCFL